MCCFMILRHLGNAALYQYVGWARIVYVCEVIGLTKPGSKSKSTAPEADALSTRPL